MPGLRQQASASGMSSVCARICQPVHPDRGLAGALVAGAGRGGRVPGADLAASLQVLAGDRNGSPAQPVRLAHFFAIREWKTVNVQKELEMKSLMIEKVLFVVASCLSLAPLGLGCVLDESGDIDRVVDEVDNALWTGWTSEEFPPLLCADQRLVRGGECAGSYCDNVRLDCTTVTGTFGGSSWSTYFSEEGVNERVCGPGEWVTGIDCNNSYCDNLSIECTQVTGRSVGSCSWSAAFSEEHGPFIAPAGRFVRGMRCTGRYCDNQSYLHCQLL
jgi:hypothetical protein